MRNTLLLLSLLGMFGCKDATGCNNSGDAEQAVAKKYGFAKKEVTCVVDAEDDGSFWCEHEPSGRFFRCAKSGSSLKCIRSPFSFDVGDP